MQGTRTATPLLLLIALALLSGCETAPPKPPAPPLDETTADARRTAEQAGPVAAAEQLLERADEYTGAERTTIRLMAANWLARAGEIERTRGIVGAINPGELSATHRLRLALVRATIDLAETRPQQALKRLDVPDQRLIEHGLLSEVLRVRALARFQLGETVDALNTLVRRGERVAAADERRENHQLLWEHLSRARLPETIDPGLSDTVAGWLRLARLGQSAWEQPFRFPDRLKQWRRAHPAHPAADELSKWILAEHERRFAYPEHVALILPFEGPYQRAAEAVREGFMAALYQMRGEGRAPEVRIYNTKSGDKAARSAYRRAVDEGADMVLGPLTKNGIASISGDEALPVPTLGMNYLEDGKTAADGLYQFGLLPEDEARQVARRVAREGFRRGVALARNNEWGYRMLDAFRTDFDSRGGELLAHETYQPDQTQFSTPIMRLLHLDESRLRAQRLQSRLGRELEFEPRRRQDVEFVVLFSQEREAPMIRPQLKFHYALDLPVYATSHVYEPGNPSNEDLDGVRLTDMPWTVAPDDFGRRTREQLDALWPDRMNRLGRLFALGFDAFRLIPVLLNFEDPLSRPMPAMTGTLTMDSDRRIHRQLVWARVRNGKLHPLPPVEDIRSDQQDAGERAYTESE